VGTTVALSAGLVDPEPRTYLFIGTMKGGLIVRCSPIRLFLSLFPDTEMSHFSLPGVDGLKISAVS